MTAGEEPLSISPHPPRRAPSPKGEELPSLLKTVDSATPGKPFVQNDMRVRDELLTMDVTVQGKAYVENEMEMRGEH